jgi:hypothetical protein
VPERPDRLPEEGRRAAPAREPRGREPSRPDAPAALAARAPVLMMAFWMLLGAAAGINVARGLWHALGLGPGDDSVALPVGAGVGALAGALLGLVRDQRLLVLLMAVFAGSAAGAVAGKVPWGDVREVAGQFAGGLVGASAWAAWLLAGRWPPRGGTGGGAAAESGPPPPDGEGVGPDGGPAR